MKSVMLNSTFEDQIPCEVCGEGVMMPYSSEHEKNHSFYCNVCGAHIHIDEPVDIE